MNPDQLGAKAVREAALQLCPVSGRKVGSQSRVVSHASLRIDEPMVCSCKSKIKTRYTINLCHTPLLFFSLAIVAIVAISLYK